MTHSRLHDHNPIQVRLANFSDQDRINDFLNKDNYYHRHLDWINPLEWLAESKVFYLAGTEELIKGLFSCADEIPGCFWIRLFAASKSQPSGMMMKRLLPFVVDSLRILSVVNLYSLAFEDWYEDLLLDNDFSSSSSVVVLKHSGSLVPEFKTNDTIRIRPMVDSDIDQVTSIDHASFQPIWQNSRMVLSRAFRMADNSTVAIRNHNVIGYQMSTKLHTTAHLARLAVLPTYQNQYIGTSLVMQMICTFQKHGIRNITVNTQTDNATSLHIYNKLGFHPTGESFPVFHLPISQ